MTIVGGPGRPEAERPHISLLGLVLGYGPILPIVVTAILVWVKGHLLTSTAVWLVQIWGAVILAFIAGVRRGTSFYTAGGPAASELVTALGFFAVAFLALIVPANWAMALLTLGYLVTGLADTKAARKGQVPRYFAMLRPVQMTIGAVGFFMILIEII